MVKKAGFDRPILHGLCTLGFSIRGFQTNYDHEIKEIGVRFTSPVFPGQELEVKYYEVKDQFVFETSSVGEKNVVVAKGFIKV